MKKILIVVVALISAVAIFFYARTNPFTRYEVGQAIDSLHGVVVYYNGSVSHSGDRNVSADGYNIGIKYQCVEFVKRYYYQHLHHKMPNSYGNAIDFFDRKIADGGWNIDRGLLQFSNGSITTPKESDLIIFSATDSNPYGHVAIVSSVENDELEIIQQNPGASASSRKKMTLKKENGKWTIENHRIVGWLRMKS